jgi:hypothetical protein
MDYEYLDNFKILQKAFKSNGVDKVSLKLRAVYFLCCVSLRVSRVVCRQAQVLLIRSIQR